MAGKYKYEVGAEVRIIATNQLGIIERVIERHRAFGGGLRYRVRIFEGASAGRVLTKRKSELERR